MMRKLTWALSLLLLTGCFGPQYNRPSLCIPDSWRMETDEGDTLCNFRWWEQFEDPVLNCLIQAALANNQDLQVAISRVMEYYGRLGVANAPLFPAINLNGLYNRIKPSESTPVDTLFPNLGSVYNDFQGYFSLSWEIDLWGRLRSASAAACADLLATIEVRRGVVVTVVTSVANAYFNLRGLDAQLDVSQKTLKSRYDSLKLAKDRFEIGETSLLEVKQAEAEVEEAAIRALELERDIPIQENLLSILIGENPHGIVRGRTVDAFPTAFEIPAGLPADLLCQRPDVAAAEDRLIAADARISQAIALFFPQITLTGQYGRESDKLSQFLSTPSTIWQYGFNLVEPIFNAGQTFYQVEEATSVRDELLHTYYQVILQAFREVDDALVSNEWNRKLVVEHQKQVKVLQDYLKLATARYLEGEIDYLNVLDAERVLFDAQLALAQAQADSLVAIVDLYGALGGGWVQDADSMALTEAFMDDCDTERDAFVE